MSAVYFIYGLAFFSLGLAVALEARRESALALSRHLGWLAAFGLTHALVEWADLFLLIESQSPLAAMVLPVRIVLLPVSALLLVRFGVGLISEAGPLPEWMMLAPVALVVPVALLAAYALVVAITEPPFKTAADVWSRYLLYFPGCLLAAFGFVRQGRRLPQAGLGQARDMLLGAALAFGFNAVVAGLIVPPATYGLAPWLNYETAFHLTHVPVQAWRALSAVTVTLLVIRAMGVFEAERKHHLALLSAEREQVRQATLRAQSEARSVAEEWTNALVSVSRCVADMKNVDEVLIAILDQARRLLHSDVAALGLWNESGLQLDLKCYALASGTQAVVSTPIRNSIITDLVQRERPCRIPEETSGPEAHWLCPALKREIQALGLVPLHLNGQSLGGLWVAREAPISFSLADLTGLERLADQAVIALEHALMAARLQSLAVLEERSRIAREMHDSLAQVLGYLSLEMQTLERLVQQGDGDAALAELRQARTHIREAQADVRESILSLRTTLSGRAGLVPALQEYVDEFEVQTGIKTTVLSDLDSEPRLSPLAEAQLVRIVQEALTNVRKHAHATRVHIRLMAPDGCLSVRVADDGCGFEAQSVGRGHFGLQTMRERAESVGGGCTVSSAPGAGTQIEVWLPCVPV